MKNGRSADGQDTRGQVLRSTGVIMERGSGCLSNLPREMKQKIKKAVRIFEKNYLVDKKPKQSSTKMASIHNPLEEQTVEPNTSSQRSRKRQQSSRSAPPRDKDSAPRKRNLQDAEEISTKKLCLEKVCDTFTRLLLYFKNLL